LDRLAELDELGARPTRLDLPMDWRDGGAQGLIGEVIASKERGEVCRVRRVTPIVPTTNRGRVVGETVNLGERGADRSSVCLYDKGLEQRTLDRGEWVRWEARFQGKKAVLATERLLRAYQLEREGGSLFTVLMVDGVEVAASWRAMYVALAFGVVDFRSPAGKSRSLRRRKRCEWWAALLGECDPVTVRVHREAAPSWERKRRWYRTVVLPDVRGMAEAANVSLAEFLEDVGGSRIGGSPVVKSDYVRWRKLRAAGAA
jgi:hypothetical protein